MTPYLFFFCRVAFRNRHLLSEIPLVKDFVCRLQYSNPIYKHCFGKAWICLDQKSNSKGLSTCFIKTPPNLNLWWFLAPFLALVGMCLLYEGLC